MSVVRRRFLLLHSPRARQPHPHRTWPAPGAPRVLALLLLLAGAACGACRPAAPPAPSTRPVIVITIDTLRADHVTAAHAPALDRLARESIAFDTAISVGPLTLPAHASLLTGLYPTRHGVRDNDIFSLPAGMPTYPAWFKTRGYDTGAFVSAIVLDRRFGLDAGFDRYDDAIGDSPERAARETLQRAEAWLADRAADRPDARTAAGAAAAAGSTGQNDPSGQSGAVAQAGAPRPFFLWIHLFEPHAPYRTGDYAGEVRQVDQELERFFATLRARGLWDDALLSVTADHGESLGEHGEQTHGFFVYDSTIRIPWILKAPGLAARRIASQVRLVDVLPTMAALSGAAGQSAAGQGAASQGAAGAAGKGTAEVPPIPDVDGVNLAPYLTDGRLPELEAYSETFLPRNQFNWSELRALRMPAAKYIAAPKPELYLLPEDPAEARNRVADRRDTAAPMQDILTRLSARQPAAPTTRAAEGAGGSVDLEKFLALGYLGHAPQATAAAAGAVLPDPKDKLALYRLVMSALELSEAGKPDAALDALRQAQRLDASVTQVHYLAGVILGGQQRYAEAAAALERAVALNPRHVVARFKLALAYVRLGQADRAEQALHTVLRDEPRNVRALHNLAAIAYTRGDVRRTEELERQALAIDRNYFEAWNTLGAVYIVSGRTADALDALATATRLNPTSGQALYNLALAQRASGDTTAAAATAQRACALDPRYCR